MRVLLLKQRNKILIYSLFIFLVNLFPQNGVIDFYKPIVIGGDTHQYTSGFNLRYIVDNNLGPGAEIQIIKSGDVIPYIYNILKII